MKNIYAHTEAAYTQPAYISVNTTDNSTAVRFTVREQGKEYGANIELTPEQCEHLATALLAHLTGETQPTEQANGQEVVALTDECLVAIHAAACTLGNFGSYFFGSSRQGGLRQDQVEQYQEMHKKAEEGVNALMDLHDQLRGLQPDNTTPPAQPAREWVGLTGDEVQVMAFRAVKAHPEWRHLNCTVPVGAEAAPFVAELYRAIESKLREKNAGLPAALPDDIPAILKTQAS